ncbi:hypothetical protein [Tichowtungia aerotolerans]|uniref:Uncharacterized protein n=1 Tax=Tichowtungia aerotolerans TaxID=2697043 RepID=A0A6P1MC78_9BACT|nr:hypothetical protein [Tichowtungia aerotolerans]QHI69196.1 hypothetical protein GT409_06935 [Tichowtungia aerotolerans]
MNENQLDLLIKALVDGTTESEALARRAGVEPAALVPLQGEIDRAVSFVSGYFRFASEEMKPAGLPPPPNPYLNKTVPMDEQSPECYAFEAVQRENMTLAKCLFVCTQLGLSEEAAKTAIDNVSIPWREANGWRSYVKQDASGCFILMDKTPVKLKQPLVRLRERCQALLEK